MDLDADALLGEAGGGLAILEQVIDEGILAVGAEAVGCMEVLYKGHGGVLQDPQAVRPADRQVPSAPASHGRYVHGVRAGQVPSCTWPPCAWPRGYGPEAQKAVSAFKVQVGKSGRFVGQNAVQLHGGMGMTDELNIGHYFKRLTMIDALFGNVDYHLKRFGSL